MSATGPAALLEAARDSPRGFWARGESWVAHAAPIASAEVWADEGDRRFTVVRDAAAELFGRLDGEGVARVYGGFSFSAEGDRTVSTFPAAILHLPEVELKHRRGVWTLMARGRSRAEADEAWDRWADAVVHRVERRHAPGMGPVSSQPLGKLTEADGGSPEAAYGAWTREVEAVLGRIAAGEVDKVVLARALDFRPGRRMDPVELALALWSGNSRSHVFFFQPGKETALVGASPEILAEVRGRTIRATAVAGSAPSPVSAAERRRFAVRLLESAKDRDEHDFVARHIEGTLTDLGCRVRRDVSPAVLDLGAIQHLETGVTAEVPPSVTALELLAALHPTPAVCGYPRDAARAILKEAESFDREWYAGPVGWLASDGDARFVPALRSAIWKGDSWRLYAGAGIVEGSDPEREWEETELKFRPMLRAMAQAQCAGGHSAAAGK